MRRERVEAMKRSDVSAAHHPLHASERPGTAGGLAATAAGASTTTSWRRGQWDSEGWRVDTTIDRNALGLSNDAACAQAARDNRGSYEAQEAASFDLEAFKALKMQVRAVSAHSC
jgi:hypothetical protein